jgi:diguanylate cyclase (GGDEF)-like protein/PAS domain S-box-containing protein
MMKSNRATNGGFASVIKLLFKIFTGAGKLMGGKLRNKKAASNRVVDPGMRFLDETTDLLAIVDRKSHYRFVNRAYADIHGKNVEDFTGSHAKDFLGEDVFETIVRPNLEKTFAGEKITYESAFDFGEGRIRYMEVRYFPLRNDRGEIEFAAIVNRDVTELKKSETTHKKSGEFLYKMVNTIEDPVFVKDENLRYVVVNEKYCTLLDKKRDEITGKTDHDIYAQRLADEFEKIDRIVLSKFEPVLSENNIFLQNENLALSTKKSLFVDSLTGQKFIVGTIRDITEQKKTAEILSYMATHDPLTGLPNRMLFYEHLKLQLHHAERFHKIFALVALDLDKFKQVNDELGHAAGDNLLIEVSGRLCNLLRKSDTVSRIGGDEFILILPELKNTEEACSVAEKILSEIKKPYILDGHEALISVSIGIATYPDCGTDGDTLKKNADEAMYIAKNKGRDAYCCFGSEPKEILSPQE